MTRERWTPGNLDYYAVPPREFTLGEHETWRALYRRQEEVLRGRAYGGFMDALSTLGIREDCIPAYRDINAVLGKLTGWQLMPVAELLPDDAFFELLASRRLPVCNYIRSWKAMDEHHPDLDVFHDLFGHAPLIADPVFGDYVAAFGKGCIKASELGAMDRMARLYFHTIRFGLIREPQGLRIYGSNLLSSAREAAFCLDDPSPHRIKFNLERVLRTRFHLDDFQDNYFVIDGFRQLFDDTALDFAPLYDSLYGKPEYDTGILVPGDEILHAGTGVYAAGAARRRAEREKAEIPQY